MKKRFLLAILFILTDLVYLFFKGADFIGIYYLNIIGIIIFGLIGYGIGTIIEYFDKKAIVSGNQPRRLRVIFGIIGFIMPILFFAFFIYGGDAMNSPFIIPGFSILIIASTAVAYTIGYILDKVGR